MELRIPLGRIQLVGLLMFAVIEFVAIFFSFDGNGISRYTPAALIRKPTLQNKLEVALKKAAVTRKTIVFWSKGSPSLTKRLMEHLKKATSFSPNDECGQCWFTTDMRRVDDSNTAAVVFNYQVVIRGNMPKNRRNDQLYVWWTNESPANLLYSRKRDLEFEDSIKFNATMGYRRDCDIYRPYFSSNNKFDGLFVTNLTWILPTKSSWAVAAVSDCDAFSGAKSRLKYIQQISTQSGGKLRTVGSCFHEKLPRNDYEIIDFIRPFKFYLAFENSYHCRDYITEKLFKNSFLSNTVPVVWGASKPDYQSLAPPNSFIFAEDFSTIESLIKYLDYLDRNNTAYLEYFRWRTMDFKTFPQHRTKRGLCQLCRIVHGINIDDANHHAYARKLHPRPLLSGIMSQRTISSLREWFYNTEHEECLASDIPLNL